MSDDEQSSGGRTLRVGKKKDGPNWFMIAGGAVVMAVSVVLGRRKILSEGEKTNERTPDAGARTQAASHEDDETGSVRTYDAVLNGTPYWDKSESAVASKAEFESRSFKTKRSAPTDPSPQVSKYCRQLSHNSVCQSNKEPVQSDSHTSTALQTGLAARREVVHRLRQQIRSRDSMIYDMQTQLSDQDQMIAMHRNHSVDLQECVQAISTKLFETNLEVQRLHRELMAQRAKPIVDLDEECIEIAVAEIKRQWVHPKDAEELVLEARKLNEEVERLEREKEAKNSLAQAKSRQCELLCKKVSTLATELEEVKTTAQGKQRLLEVKEQENFKLANVLQDLQHKFELQDRGNDWASSKLSRWTDACNTQSSWKMNHDVGRPATPTNYEEVSSTCKGVIDGNYQQAGNQRTSHGSVHARNDIQQDSEDSVAKAESRCVSDAHTKRCGEPIDQDGRVDDYDNNEKIDESLILKFDHEVDQVASALFVTSKVVSEQMQGASRILMDFQEHIDSRTDAQPNRSVAQIGPQAWKGVEFSQVFSCLSEGMSAEQKQEMRNEFEQVAKQQDVEREMKVLTKHQTKLRELKCAVAKFTARFNGQNSEDDTSNMEMLQFASSLSVIEQKLAVQEEIAKETSSFIEQLSTLFQLSSPQNPPVQEIWRTVKETSGNPTSVNRQQKHFIRFSDEKSRNTLQKLDEQNSSRILERQDSSSALRHFSTNRINTERLTSSPMKLLDNPYQFQLGASSGPISRPRGRTTLAAGRTSFRRPATHHENTVGLKRQTICVGEPSEQNSRDRVTHFRLNSEATSGFSFGLSADDRPLDNVGKQFSQAAESGVQQLEAIVGTAQPYEQGDRMSSPEPEPSTHMFSEQRFSSFNTSEPSVGNATFSKGFRSNSGSETSPNFNSMQSPAYDDRYSQFGSPQSPCFGVTIDETSSRRPLFTQASSPLAASSNSRLDSDRDFQIKRSTEENFSYNSNPNCSPRLHDVNAAHSSDSVGVSPFAARLAYLDVRQPGSPMSSLRNFETRNERDHHFACQEDVDVDVSHRSVHSRVTNLAEDRQLNSYTRDLESLSPSDSNPDTKDSSGSCNPDEPVTFLPSLLRRSNSSNHQH